MKTNLKTNSMSTKVTMTSKTIATRFAALGLFSGLLLGLSGCPLQTAAVEVGIGVSGDITVVASAGSPAVGQTLTLTAQAPASAMVSFIGATWTSSNPAVLEITSSSGASATAVARKAGAATVTVRASGKAGSRTINVLESVGSIEVEGKTSLDFGDESEYTAQVTDNSGKTIAAVVSWSASGTLELVGTAVSGAKMKVRAKGVGTGAVTAQAGGKTAQVIVNVAPGKAKLAVAQSDGTAFPAMIAAGQSVVARAQFELNTLKDPAKSAQWSVTGGCSLSSTTGATVQITGSASGTCMVTATANGLTAMASFTVITVTAVKITGDVTGALKLGATRMLTAVAQSDGKDVPGVPVAWTQTNGAVTLTTAGNVVTATGVGVGSAMLRAAVGAIAQTATFAVEPQALEIKVGVDVTTTVPVLAGGGATVTVTPKGNGGVTGKFIAVDGVALIGATGFTTVGPATLGAQGLVTFALSGATAASPAVKATFGAVQSNAIAFTITTIKTVTVTGPTADVRVGEALELMVVVKDADGKTIPEGGVPVAWADPTGVLTVPATTDGFSVSANVVKLGSSGLVATVKGVASAAYVVTGVPGSVTMTEFSPRTVPVGGTATATVTVLDVQGRVITGVPAAQIIATSTDATKVTVTAPVAAGNAFTVTATGVALAPAPGAGVTVKWDSGTSNVTGDTRQLIVAAGQVAWEGSCVATPVGPKTWRVSGFQGATSGGNAIVYDIYAALGAAAMTNSSKVASDGMSGVAKDVTVASVAGDWNFGVVARASDGATSGVVACTRGATVSHTAVASSALVLGAGGSAVYADDVASAVAATNPRPLFISSAAGANAAALALDRTAPRASASFGGGLVGIGVSAGGAQILYKRPATGAGSDSYGVPTMLAGAKTDSSGGVCKSRAGITAFELAGKATAASALSSFAMFTSTGTATGEAADCALNVLAFREGATKTIASGVDRAAPFGDHRLGYTFGGALFDVDLTTGSKLPRLLADDGIAAGSLIAAVNPTAGTAGAIEATSIYVLSPAGVLSRYTVGAPPLTAVASPITAALAGADGLVAVDADTLFVTVGGVLKVIEVTGAGPLAVTVTARDYATFGAFPVTLGSSTAAAQ